jgi:hypothetical protein
LYINAIIAGASSISPSNAMIIVSPVIRPKEMRLFIDEKVKMKNPAERTMVVSSIALPVEVSVFSTATFIS